MICPKYLTEGLEKTYRGIHRQRMQGIPVLNDRLSVKAVGFRDWQGHCLGVLVTPWLINLMLIPVEGDDWRELKVGEKVYHRFPSGTYEFIVGAEKGIGRYQMCSLFSPVFQFEDQAAAVATAEAALEALMDEESRDTSGFDEGEIERRWRGEPVEAEGEAAEAAGKEEGEAIPSGISRRGFITGGLSRDEGLPSE